MKKGLILTLFSAIIAVTGCTISNDQTVVWQYDMDYDVAAGVVQDNNYNYVFFADVKGKVFSVWMDTGNARHVWNFTNENVSVLHTQLYTDGSDALFVATTNKLSSVSKLRKLDFGGESLWETNLALVVHGDVASYTNSDNHIHLILHSSDKIARIDVNSFPVTIEIVTAASYGMNDVSKVIVGKDGASIYYYALDSTGRVFKIDSSLNLVASSPTAAKNFYGAVIYYNNKLYVADSQGLHVHDAANISFPPGNYFTEHDIKYTPMLIDPITGMLYIGYYSFNNTPYGGIGKYDLNDNLSRDWTSEYQGFDHFSYSPLYYSYLLEYAAIVDDAGYLNLVDAKTGVFIDVNHYLGVISKPNLKWAHDYNGKAVYIAVNIPSRIYCISLENAATGGE
ncbi:MAG: hypothetical protein A2Y33_01735 [Spirochaetes bacterium GWF1_51_8]|nr:MAG: hypothetical protein A2Y33_01735 [Spirochaetes bacterium GWF1_51_8]